MDNSNQLLRISNISKNTIIILYDINGKQLLTQTSNSNINIDMSHFAKGIYTVKVIDTNRTYTQKVIKEL